VIRVFSGNLWWGKADPDGLVALIREHGIDVFAAQELGFENAEAIASELPHGCLEPDATYHGMGVALRHPGKYERIPLRYRDARRAVLDPGDWPGLAQAIDLVNVHFQAPHSMRPFPPPWEIEYSVGAPSSAGSAMKTPCAGFAQGSASESSAAMDTPPIPSIADGSTRNWSPDATGTDFTWTTCDAAGAATKSARRRADRTRDRAMVGSRMVGGAPVRRAVRSP